MNRDRGPRTPTQILLIVMGVAALIFAVLLLLRVARSCDRGVEHRAQGECIGVTDGHFKFARDLKDVEDKILTENQRVAKTQGYVSIAVLRPMTGLDAGDETALHSLEGAYTAQATANSGSTHERPLIRLLLANDGRDDAQWGPVVDELKQRAGPGSADHLLAVTGFAQS